MTTPSGSVSRVEQFESCGGNGAVDNKKTDYLIATSQSECSQCQLYIKSIFMPVHLLLMLLQPSRTRKSFPALQSNIDMTTMILLQSQERKMNGNTIRGRRRFGIAKTDKMETIKQDAKKRAAKNTHIQHD